MSNVPALEGALKLVIDAVKDASAAVAAGKTSWSSLPQYENLLGDLFTALPALSDLETELQNLSLADVQTLLAAAVSDLGDFAPGLVQVLATAETLLKDLSPSFAKDAVGLAAKVLGAWGKRATAQPPRPSASQMAKAAIEAGRAKQAAVQAEVNKLPSIWAIESVAEKGLYVNKVGALTSLDDPELAVYATRNQAEADIADKGYAGTYQPVATARYQGKLVRQTFKLE